MDSKPTFGLLLVALGLAGVWFLVTGRFSAIIAWAQNGYTGPDMKNASFGTYGTPSTTSGPAMQNSSFGTYGTTSTPSNGARTSMNQTLGSSALAYGVVLGDTGAKIEPVGGVGYG